MILDQRLQAPATGSLSTQNMLRGKLRHTLRSQWECRPVDWDLSWLHFGTFAGQSHADAAPSLPSISLSPLPGATVSTVWHTKSTQTSPSTNVFKCTTDVFKCTTNVVKGTTNVFKCTTNLFKCTTNVFKCTTNVFKRTRNVFKCTTNVFKRTRNVFKCTTNVFKSMFFELLPLHCLSTQCTESAGVGLGTYGHISKSSTNLCAIGNIHRMNRSGDGPFAASNSWGIGAWLRASVARNHATVVLLFCRRPRCISLSTRGNHLCCTPSCRISFDAMGAPM